MNKEPRHILSLSGGKDSTALAIHMRDRVPEMEYVFCDTGEELRETYRYLDQVEAYLGKPITRLNSRATFDHWLKVFGGYLPSPRMRWCTKMLKLKPFEEFIGEDPVISYIGIRADEDRTGYISHRDNITTVYPYKEDGIDLNGVMRILEESGIGMPPYMEWGRTHSGCYFCFFQMKIEWVRLLETYPADFDKAQRYEEENAKPGRDFTWIQGMPLRELRKGQNVASIKQEHAAKQHRLRETRTNKKLVEIFGPIDDSAESAACLICRL
ncbi:MAG TPA: phosphoadenosine phosphosulfate reductase family protein [Myxococcota bacterium]|nr:phosphoadenosine phosphosulfate reductase family protein [Myxococcota bacterium]